MRALKRMRSTAPLSYSGGRRFPHEGHIGAFPDAKLKLYPSNGTKGAGSRLSRIAMLDRLSVNTLLRSVIAVMAASVVLMLS